MADVLVVGSGGREHAIAVKMAASPKVAHVFCAPGNGGTATEAKMSNVALADSDITGLVNFAKEKKVALVFVGPEAPLCAGLADKCEEAGLPCFGPKAAAAELENSKAFSKTFFAKHELPTAAFKNFTDSEYDAACAYIKAEYAAGREVVVKASGIAAGKGVLMPSTLEEALDALKTVLVDKAFGAAGKEVVVEQLLLGEEVSCMAFCDGKGVSMMPAAQDHKRALDGDQGLNTGGMGAYAPAPCLTPDLAVRTKAILQKTVEAMAGEGRCYVGVLYGGFMLTKDGPMLLEYNCRFGDPETEVLLPLLQSDLFEVALGCAEGNLAARVPEVRWKAEAAATVVCAAKGYPGSYPKGLPIAGVDAANACEGVKVYHAGTKAGEAGPPAMPHAPSRPWVVMRQALHKPSAPMAASPRHRRHNLASFATLTAGFVMVAVALPSRCFLGAVSGGRIWARARHLTVVRAAGTEAEIREEVSKLRAREMKRELEALGVDAADAFEKDELAERLVQARLQGKVEVPEEPEVEATGPSAVADSPDRSGDVPPEILERCRAMRVSELRAELGSRDVSWADALEKEELVARLARILAQEASFSHSARLRPGEVGHLSAAELQQELQPSETPLLLDVYATWCGPCQIMAPHLDAAAKRLGGTVRVAKMDSDEEPNMASQLRVGALPTIIVFDRSGVEVERQEGALMEQQLVELVQAAGV